MTNLNVHLGALAYSRALHQICGAPVMYAKIFTVVQTKTKKRPFFGMYNSDRIQLLPLIVGHEYIFMESGTIIKRGAKVTLVYVDRSGEDDNKCQFVIVVDEYRVFYKVSMRHFNLPLLCSSRRNYLSNYPPEQVDAMRSSTLYEVYGFPLSLACFSNIYQSQGATISDQVVFLNLTGCTSNEIYVGMSRCRSLEQIEQIIL
ncbi:unnamed protein product [Euphydryas editha]|uniref:Uncharacterized protein n=1 Tax=Euphydryas editha TaxID=104508 RepID=A0AAU9VGU0_EUPED|nr:unnamed protein product [Euphydryas editha]